MFPLGVPGAQSQFYYTVGGTSEPPQNIEMKILQPTAHVQPDKGIVNEICKAVKTMPISQDIHSNARLDEASVTHMKFHLEKVDFDAKVIDAKVTFTYSNHKTGINERLILDTKDLHILSIKVNGAPAAFEVKTLKELEPDAEEYKPDALFIAIPKEAKKGSIEITYRTSPEANGLFWIKKECTDTKKAPIVFTQFEPTEGASVIPGQHTPQNRITWEASGNTKDPALMFIPGCEDTIKEATSDGIYPSRKMSTRCPLYLFSFTVGNYAYQPLSEEHTVGIFGEKETITDTALKYHQLPMFINTIGKLLGRPLWKDWKAVTPVQLPTAFPYTAMENVATIYFGGDAKDQQNAHIHEALHYWFGNLVTNAHWEYFWLNEGTTSYGEMRAIKECLGEEYASLIAHKLVEEMKTAVKKNLDADNENNNKLVVPIEKKPADTPFVHYGKGFLFLKMLENAIGRDVWDAMLCDYMEAFAQSAIDANRFLKFLEIEFIYRKPSENFEAFKKQHLIDEWLNSPDMPSNTPLIHSSLAIKLQETQNVFLGGKKGVLAQIKEKTPLEIAVFIASFTKAKISHAELKELEEGLGVLHDSRLIIRKEWAKLCAAKGYLTHESKNFIKRYMIERNSAFQNGIISTDLVKFEDGKELLRQTIEEGKELLFPLVKQKMERILTPKQ